jgi:hypothetical protein
VACDAGGLSFELSEGTGWISRTCEEQIPALQPLKKLDQALDLALEAAVELLVGLQEVTRSHMTILTCSFLNSEMAPACMRRSSTEPTIAW